MNYQLTTFFFFFFKLSCQSVIVGFALVLRTGTWSPEQNCSLCSWLLLLPSAPVTGQLLDQQKQSNFLAGKRASSSVRLPPTTSYVVCMHADMAVCCEISDGSNRSRDWIQLISLVKSSKWLCVDWGRGSLAVAAMPSLQCLQSFFSTSVLLVVVVVCGVSDYPVAAISVITQNM